MCACLFVCARKCVCVRLSVKLLTSCAGTPLPLSLPAWSLPLPLSLHTFATLPINLCDTTYTHTARERQQHSCSRYYTAFRASVVFVCVRCAVVACRHKRACLCCVMCFRGRGEVASCAYRCGARRSML